jgi:hypothetical protein
LPFLYDQVSPVLPIPPLEVPLFERYVRTLCVEPIEDRVPAPVDIEVEA